MVEGGLHGKSNAVPRGGGNATRRNHLTHSGEPDTRLAGAAFQTDLLVTEDRWEDAQPKVNFVRYADDFIITGSSKQLLENEVKPLVEPFLLERGLQLSPEKTCIPHIEDGSDFLG